MKKITVEQVNEKIAEFQKKYLNPALSICGHDQIHDLKKGASKYYPFTHEQGVYAILAGKSVLYIGKASSMKSNIGKRAGSYFYKDGSPKSNHTWTKPPTHLAAWKAPEGAPFIATALEQFLIQKLGPPDNTRGR